MLRTVIVIGLLAVLGWTLLPVALGLVGGLLGLAISVLLFLVRAALVGLVIYGIVRLVSPETARRWRERFSGTA